MTEIQDRSCAAKELTGTRLSACNVQKGVRELSSEALLKEILQKPCPFAKSDVFLKFTKVNRNLAPAVLMEKALAKEKGTYLMASGALATLSGEAQRSTTHFVCVCFHAT